jgi:homoserine O-succinyltransferase/O-acetyltransferase
VPLTVDGPIPAHLTSTNACLGRAIGATHTNGAVRVALVNNMSDTALEDTEAQFCGLLAEAANQSTVHVGLFSLPNVPRSERGQQHLRSFYRSTDELWNESVDAVIITGTEPRTSDLCEEPYWSALAELFDWAETNTDSAILSCLAAHAGALHSDGIVRHRLSDKQFGLFDQTIVAQHPLINGLAEPIRFPHSRWPESPESELAANGYTILTRSTEAGVDSFLKKKKNSLFIHFQGHPEYGAQTLLKEYRRDIGRFLRNEREIYPSMPHGYFDSESAWILAEFQANAVIHRNEELLAAFPQASLAGALQHCWRNAAVGFYRNWLQYLASRKRESRSTIAVTASYGIRMSRGSMPADMSRKAHTPQSCQRLAASRMTAARRSRGAK